MAKLVRSAARPQIRKVLSGLAAATTAIGIFATPALAVTGSPPPPIVAPSNPAVNQDVPQSGAHNLQRPLPKASAKASTQSTSSATYDDPSHVDVESFVDEDTGEVVELRSGITHWEEADPDSPGVMTMAVTDSELFKNVTIYEQGTSQYDYQNLRMTVDLDVPNGAQAGDTHYLNIAAPFAFTGVTSALEVKDASGTVFAIVHGVRPPASLDGLTSKYNKLRVTFTQAVDEHVEIEGFFDIALTWYNANVDVKSKAIITSGDGTLVGQSAKTYTVLKAVPITSCMSPGFGGGGGSVINPETGSSQQGMYTRITFGQGWKPNGAILTITPKGEAATGAHPTCKVSVTYEGFNSEGYWQQNWNKQTVAATTCDKTTGKVTIGQDAFSEISAPSGATGGRFSVSTQYYTDKASYKYESFDVKLTAGSTPACGGNTFAFTANNQAVTSSSVPTAGADSLTLDTTKTSAVTSAGSVATIGDTITYTIIVKPGASNDRVVSGVIVEDRFPSDLEFVSATGNGQYDASSGVIIWPTTDLPSTGQLKYTVVGKIKSVPTNGKIKNSVAVATAGEVCSDDDDVSTCDATATDEVGKPSFKFTKSSTVKDTNDNGYLGDEGDTVVYSFKVTNTGDIPITTAKLTDKMLGVSGVECLATGTTVSPGASANCVGTYEHVITDADVTAGKVTNHATLCVDPEFGLDCEPDDTTTTTLKPAFNFVKHSEARAASDDRGFDGIIAGDTIEYWFTVSNTGNVALKDVTIDDDLVALKGATCVSDLPVGAKDVKCSTTATYKVTKADQEKGMVLNHAVAKTPGLPDQPSEVTDPVDNPAFEFKKHSEAKAAPGDRGFDGIIAGDTITYWFTVKNTGDLDLTEVVINDALLGLKNVQCLPDGTPLKVGKTAECKSRYDYTITEADHKAGKVYNHALATVPGLPEVPGDVTDPVDNPAFEFTKSVVEIVDTKGEPVTGGKALLGDKLHFGFSATNTGDVDIKSLLVTDPMLNARDVQCLADGAVLKVGESVDCVDNASYWHVVTDADVKAGKVHNIATGSVPGLPDVPGETTTPVLPPAVDTKLPKTGSGGTWLLIGTGTALTLGGAYALTRLRRARVASDLPA